MWGADPVCSGAEGERSGVALIGADCALGGIDVISDLFRQRAGRDF